MMGITELPIKNNIIFGYILNFTRQKSELSVENHRAKGRESSSKMLRTNELKLGATE